METTQGWGAINKCENYFTADGQEQSDYHKKQPLLPVSYLVYLGSHYISQSSHQCMSKCPIFGGILFNQKRLCVFDLMIMHCLWKKCTEHQSNALNDYVEPNQRLIPL